MERSAHSLDDLLKSEVVNRGTQSWKKRVRGSSDRRSTQGRVDGEKRAA